MSIGSAISGLFLRSPIYRWLRRRRQQQELSRWLDGERSSPPPHLVKQNLIRRYAARFGCDTLVETGTYKGDMLLALQEQFRQLYSIELHQGLHERVCQMFHGKPHVRLLQGDSGERLGDVLSELDRPALFWLDGHFSAGQTARGDLNTPVIAELERILAHPVKEHVVLIDDARLFNGTDDYPTVEFLKARLNQSGSFNVVIEDDAIAITRRAA
ncbi:MAG: hypothetical protein R3B90_11710 [Planctomycetaceae bacterium]